MPKTHLSQQKSSTNLELGMWTRRLGVYLAGLFFLALGVALSIKSNLGVSPINTVPYVLSQVTAMDVGLMTAMVNTTYVLIQFIVLKKDMPPINILQVASGVAFGLFVTVANYILTLAVPAAPASNWLRLGLLGISILILGLGTLLYLTADLIPKPSEGMILAIQKKSGWQLSRVKTGFDCSMVAISFMISINFSGKIIGIGIGTLITALSVGSVLGIMKKLYYTRTRTFCFGKAVGTEVL